MASRYPLSGETIIPLFKSVDELGEPDFGARDGCTFVSIPIGESTDGRWLTTVDAGFRRRSNEQVSARLRPCDFHEFAYEICLVDTFGEHRTFETMDRDVARGWLPVGSAPLVLETVRYGCAHLVNLIEPTLVYRVTNGSGLPAPAMEKYNFVRQALESKGYYVMFTERDGLGREFWLMGTNEFDVSTLMIEDEP